MPRNIVSRVDRLKSYAKMEGPAGAGRDQSNIDYWSRRAEANSQLAPRASDGPIKLPKTNVTTRDTSGKRYNAGPINARMVAKQDENFAGSSPYMKGVRRTTA